MGGLVEDHGNLWHPPQKIVSIIDPSGKWLDVAGFFFPDVPV